MEQRCRILGLPYCHNKFTGDTDATQVWSQAVAMGTQHLRPVTGPVRLEVTFFLTPEKYPSNFPYGPDLDNLLKRFLDAMKETVFRSVLGGDSCVVEVLARKWRVAEDPGAELVITQIGELHVAHACSPL